ncbi:hypothetical protein [Ornithinimicrobium tianjinense]|uniref:Uncharacterized protein n=1 Tax=Ornithinimicrobium tianjinense TaxID=1195761 RepID=A0A917F9T0_9MICO|nr:hypothetical protein [Ornithinimicrobium tianjinense]GGF58325.1 hypothetical protein GCM10011366_27670 [Ornithinimicrobium tianjinense]
MSTRQHPQHPSNPSHLAPHVDRAWADTFVVEQRLADRTGEQIGDALAVVDAHCAESGESAEEAFGDPADYSRALIGRPIDSRLSARTAVGIASGVLALMTLPRAVAGWRQGEGFLVTTGDIVAGLVVAALAVLILARPTPVLRWLVAQPARSFLAVFGVLIALVVPQALLRHPVADPGWAMPLVVGLVLLALSVALPWRDLAVADPVRDPRRHGAGRPDAAAWLTALTFPVLAAIMIGMDEVVRTLL